MRQPRAFLRYSITPDVRIRARRVQLILGNISQLLRHRDGRRERQMKQFKSAGQAQRFLSAHDQINNLFHFRRDHITAAQHRASRTQKFHIWAEICSVGLQ